MAKKEIAQDENSTELNEKQIDLIDKALAVQAPLAREYVRRLRKKRSHLSDDELVAAIEKRFVRLAAVTGVGIGGTAALPGVGTAAAMALTVGEGLAFAEACAFLALGVAEIRNVDMSDPSVRRTVILGIIGGEKGSEIVTKALGKGGLQWSTVLNGMAPEIVTTAVNKQVNRWIKRTITRRFTGVWAGRIAPFGIGAVIGGVGNTLLAKSVIEATRNIFEHADSVEGEVIQSDKA